MKETSSFDYTFFPDIVIDQAAAPVGIKCNASKAMHLKHMKETCLKIFYEHPCNMIPFFAQKGISKYVNRIIHLIFLVKTQMIPNTFMNEGF